MKKYLLLYAVITTALLIFGLRHYRSENSRLTQNQTALSTQIHHYRTKAGDSASSAQVLRLRCDEFEQLRSADAERIRALGVKLRRVEATALTVAQTRLNAHTKLRETIIISRTTPLVFDTLRTFVWRDAWVSIEGQIDHQNVSCKIQSYDTIIQVVHRIPKRFLFIRWGTKALRQEVRSTNPHTLIVHSEYIKIER